MKRGTWSGSCSEEEGEKSGQTWRVFEFARGAHEMSFTCRSLFLETLVRIHKFCVSAVALAPPDEQEAMGMASRLMYTADNQPIKSTAKT